MVTPTLPLIRRWTRREDEILLAKRRERIPFSQIGTIILRTKNSCISRYQTLTGVRKGRLYVPTGKTNG